MSAPGRRSPVRSLAPASVVLLTAAAFLPILRNGFVNWDDTQNFVTNPAYRGLGPAHLRWMFTTFHLGHYQPLAWVTLGADFLVWGMNPAGYHLTSLLFHLANALLVYAVALRLLRAAGAPEDAARAGSGAAHAESGAPSAGADAPLALAAAFAAGVFAVHPLRVESVAWATARRDVVSGFFFLLSVLGYLRSLDAPGRRAARVLSIAAFAAAVLSKEIVATLPLLLLVLDVYPLRRLRRRATLRSIAVEKIPYFALAAAIAFVGFAGQRATQAVPGLRERGLFDRAALAAYGLAFYVRKTLLPVGLSPAHVLPADFRAGAPAFVASAAAVALACAALVALRCRWPAGLAAGAAYAIALLPVLGIVQVWRQIVAERYSYLACLPIALVAGGAFLRVARRGRSGAGGAESQVGAERTIGAAAAVGTAPSAAAAAATAAAAAAALLVALAFLTAHQARVWRDPETLWRSALAADPKNYLALYNLGVAQTTQERYAEARASYESALALQPKDPETLGALGALALNEGRLDEAVRDLEQSVALWRGNATALANLGIARARRGDRAGADDAYRAALALEPSDAEAIASLGALALEAGHPDDAAERLARAVALWPENPVALTNLGILRLRRGDREGAIASLSSATRASPAFADAWKNLGVALEGSGRYADAAQSFRRYAALRPDDRDARRSLVSDLLRSGDDAAAAAAARENLARDSTDWASANFLAWVLTTSPDSALRDPAAAVGAAERALASAPDSEPNVLDTYATALASAGRFGDAATAERRAAGLAAARGDTTLAREAGARLTLFEKGAPFRGP